jgi:hypothetical protein
MSTSPARTDGGCEPGTRDVMIDKVALAWSARRWSVNG